MKQITFLNLCCGTIASLIMSHAQAFPTANKLADNPSAQPTITVDYNHSSAYGSFAHTQFANLWSPDNAAAFLVDFGANQFRIGGTWAHAFDAQHRVKVGIQHLAQSIDFNFDSGKDHRFIGQNEVSATYQFILDQPIINNLNLSGYYAKTSNNDFAVNSMPAPNDNFNNIRKVNGASLAGINTGIGFNLWQGAYLEPAITYDRIRFKPTFEPAIKDNRFGAMANFVQALTPRLALNLETEQRALYNLYGGGVQWLAHQGVNSSLSVQFQFNHLQSHLLPITQDNLSTVGFAYRWGHSATTNNATSANLLDWVQTAPEQLPEVYAMRDQTVVHK